MTTPSYIVKCLDICSAHLTEETCNGALHHHIADYRYGAFFSVPEEIDDECEPDLAVVLKFAQEQGCGLVRVDSIGDVLDELPVFDW